MPFFLAKVIQFWPASGLKGMPNTQIYDKEGQEKYLETNPAEILAINRLFKPPEMGGGTSRNGRRHLPKWEEAPPEMGTADSKNAQL